MLSPVVVMLIVLMWKERVQGHCASVTNSWRPLLLTWRMIGNRIIMLDGDHSIGKEHAERLLVWDGGRKRGQWANLVITATPEEINQMIVVEKAANYFRIIPILVEGAVVEAGRLIPS